MCRKMFSDFFHLDKVRDHCHLSGMFRYTLCSTCNLTCAKRPPEIHLFFHGLSNYDSHFIRQKLYKFSSSEIKIIQKNTEKYLSFSVDCVHFKDSYQFLSESFEQLFFLWQMLFSQNTSIFHVTVRKNSFLLQKFLLLIIFNEFIDVNKVIRAFVH